MGKVDIKTIHLTKLEQSTIKLYISHGIDYIISIVDSIFNTKTLCDIAFPVCGKVVREISALFCHSLHNNMGVFWMAHEILAFL